MSLISNSSLKAFTDRLAAVYAQAITPLGTSAGNASNGNVRGTVSNLLADIVALNDFQQEYDLANRVNAVLGKANAETMLGAVKDAVQALTDHIGARGPAVNSAVVDLPSYLTYYNGTGGAKFQCLVTPEFASLYKIWFTALAAGNVMSPALQAEWNTSLTHGMADKNTAGTFNAGASVDTTQYSEVVPVIEVRTAFANGAAPPTVTIAGTDDQGNAATWGPITLTGNNPAAALSGVTITPAITAQTKVSVACSSSTGIVAGSVLTINKGLPDQEVVIVESVADGTHFTAAFKLAHAGSATVDGWNSYAAGNASTGAGRRLRAVTGITLGLSSHNAGKIMVSGSQDRFGV